MLSSTDKFSTASKNLLLLMMKDSSYLKEYTPWNELVESSKENFKRKIWLWNENKYF